MRNSIAAMMLFAATQLAILSDAQAVERNQPIDSAVITYDSSRSDAEFKSTETLTILIARGKALTAPASIRISVAPVLSSDLVNGYQVTSLASAQISFLRALRLRAALANELGADIKFEMVTQNPTDWISPENMEPNTARIDLYSLDSNP